MAEIFQPKDQNLDDLVKKEFVLEGRKAVRTATLGLGVLAAGFTFDYGITDELTSFVGGFAAGYNLKDSINYLRTVFSKDQHTKYKSE